MNKTMRSLLFGLTLLISYCDGLVVPGEVFSLLSSAIQTIPKIAKGTDSRFGIGFRFGEHADFQTLVEIGPQKFTKPLRNVVNDDESEESDTSKRMVNLSKYKKVLKPTYGKNDQLIHGWTKEVKTKTRNHAQKSQIVENDLFKLLFGPQDQFPIPTVSIINTSALGKLQPFDSKNKEQSKKVADKVIGVDVLPMAAKIKEQHQIKSDLMDVSLEN